jgi:hypothetical protein
MSTVEEFKKLPKEVQEKVISDLAGWNRTHVTWEYGRYWVSVDYCCRDSYGADKKEIGEWSYETLKVLPEVAKARADYNADAKNYNWDIC